MTTMANLVSSFGITDVGRKRDHNEDSCLVVDDLGLYVVADGMGGHAAGEVASAKAIEVMRDFVSRCEQDDEFTWPYGINTQLSEIENVLVTAIKLANREVWRIAQEKQDHHGMGTTIAAIHVKDTEIAVAHVGDSRVYRFHEGTLSQLTQDHSWVNEQLRRGIISPEEAKNHRWKNVITRALGNKEQLEVEVGTIQVTPGDVLLVCSDGLGAGDDVSEAAIEEAIAHHHHRLHDLGKILISMANEAGGKDNITVILLKIHATPEEAEAANRDISADDTNPVLAAAAAAAAAAGSAANASTKSVPTIKAVKAAAKKPAAVNVENTAEMDFSKARRKASKEVVSPGDTPTTPAAAEANAAAAPAEAAPADADSETQAPEEKAEPAEASAKDGTPPLEDEAKAAASPVDEDAPLAEVDGPGLTPSEESIFETDDDLDRP